jgi:hypothetical protein
MLALIYVVLDAVGDDVVAEEALGRVVLVAALTLERTVRLGEEALASQRRVAEVAHEARVVVVLVLVQRHLLATVEAAAALFAADVQRVHHLGVLCMWEGQEIKRLKAV